MRVKLANKGLSQNEITEIFETFSNPQEMYNYKAIANKTLEIMNNSVMGNSYTLGLIAQIVDLIKNNIELEGVNKVTVIANKKRGKWTFIVGAS
jgi:hypothetical protein